MFDTVRTVLEGWFDRYPRMHQADLHGRFRSKDDFNHNSAFFELFLHELLIRLGCQVEVHPEVLNTTRHPDFLARSQRGKCYIEAAVVMGESRAEMTALTRLHRVYDELDKLDSPNFFFEMNTRAKPQGSLSTKQLKSWLQAWLACENPDEASSAYEALGRKGLPRRHYNLDGWPIEFVLVPKRASARGKPGVRPLGAHSEGARWVQTGRTIGRALINKAGRYGDLSLPYIVAVNAMESPDAADIMEALFGSEQYIISLENGEPVNQTPTRAPDGLWAAKGRRRRTGVSGVLVASPALPWNIPRTKLCLYHNPWALRPYEAELTRLPEAVAKGGSMEWQAGESLATLFDLPPEWPGP